MSGIPYQSQIVMQAPVVEDKHVVTKEFLVDYVSGKVKSPVRVISTANLVGTYSSVTMQFTSTANGVLAIDGVTLEIDNRVLVAGQTDKTQNGIYDVVDQGSAGSSYVLQRSSDFDNSNKIYSGVRISITEGTSNRDTEWKLVTDAPIVLDSTNLEFIKEVGTAGISEQAFDMIGDDATTAFTFSHNWGTKSVTVEAYNKATGDTTIFNIVRSSVNDIVVSSALPLGVGNDFVVIVGAKVESN